GSVDILMPMPGSVVGSAHEPTQIIDGWRAVAACNLVGRVRTCNPRDDPKTNNDDRARYHLRPLLRPAAGGDRGRSHFGPARARRTRTACRPRAAAAARLACAR